MVMSKAQQSQCGTIEVLAGAYEHIQVRQVKLVVKKDRRAARAKPTGWACNIAYTARCGDATGVIVKRTLHVALLCPDPRSHVLRETKALDAACRPKHPPSRQSTLADRDCSTAAGNTMASHGAADDTAAHGAAADTAADDTAADGTAADGTVADGTS